MGSFSAVAILKVAMILVGVNVSAGQYGFKGRHGQDNERFTIFISVAEGFRLLGRTSGAHFIVYLPGLAFRRSIAS